MSINQNWSNKSNVKEQTLFMIRAVEEVENEIEYLKKGMDDVEYFETVQRLMRANFGMNLRDFVDYLSLNEKESNEIIIEEFLKRVEKYKMFLQIN